MRHSVCIEVAQVDRDLALARDGLAVGRGGLHDERDGLAGASESGLGGRGDVERLGGGHDGAGAVDHAVGLVGDFGIDDVAEIEVAEAAERVARVDGYGQAAVVVRDAFGLRDEVAAPGDLADALVTVGGGADPVAFAEEPVEAAAEREDAARLFAVDGVFDLRAGHGRAEVVFRLDLRLEDAAGLHLRFGHFDLKQVFRLLVLLDGERNAAVAGAQVEAAEGDVVREHELLGGGGQHRVAGDVLFVQLLAAGVGAGELQLVFRALLRFLLVVGGAAGVDGVLHRVAGTVHRAVGDDVVAVAFVEAARVHGGVVGVREEGEAVLGLGEDERAVVELFGEDDRAVLAGRDLELLHDDAVAAPAELVLVAVVRVFRPVVHDLELAVGERFAGLRVVEGEETTLRDGFLREDFRGDPDEVFVPGILGVGAFRALGQGAHDVRAGLCDGQRDLGVGLPVVRLRRHVERELGDLFLDGGRPPLESGVHLIGVVGLVGLLAALAEAFQHDVDGGLRVSFGHDRTDLRGVAAAVGEDRLRAERDDLDVLRGAPVAEDLLDHLVLICLLEPVGGILVLHTGEVEVAELLGGLLLVESCLVFVREFLEDAEIAELLGEGDLADAVGELGHGLRVLQFIKVVAVFVGGLVFVADVPVDLGEIELVGEEGRPVVFALVVAQRDGLFQRPAEAFAVALRGREILRAGVEDRGAVLVHRRTRGAAEIAVVVVGQNGQVGERLELVGLAAGLVAAEQ